MQKAPLEILRRRRIPKYSRTHEDTKEVEEGLFKPQIEHQILLPSSCAKASLHRSWIPVTSERYWIQTIRWDGPTPCHISCTKCIFFRCLVLCSNFLITIHYIDYYQNNVELFAQPQEFVTSIVGSCGWGKVHYAYLRSRKSYITFEHIKYGRPGVTEIILIKIVNLLIWF